MGVGVLNEVSEFVARERARGERVAVIFDLDSTLFCVSPRTQAILRSLGEDAEFSGANGELSALLRGIEVLPSDWGIRSALERHRPSAPIEVFHRVRDYWRKHFFGNAYLDHDIVYPSAVEYVRHLAGLGAEILYLTGRNSGSMHEGTIRVLRHWGFPLDDESSLHMKPSDVQTDEGFKAERLAELLPVYNHIWFFENEPLIIEQVRARLPSVRIVFVQTVHSGRAVPPVDLPVILPDYSGGVPKK